MKIPLVHAYLGRREPPVSVVDAVQLVIGIDGQTLAAPAAMGSGSSVSQNIAGLSS